MSTSFSRKILSTVAALLLFVALPAIAQKRVGKPGGGGSSIQWNMQITGHDLVVLTVSTPDGETISREFGPGRDPSFELNDLETVEDGQYTYELRVVPKISENVKRKLAEARAKNDEKAAKKIRKDAGLLETVAESGAFTVVNGSIVSPDLVENDANDAAAFRAVTTDQGGRSGVPGNVTTNRPWTPVVNDQVIPDDLIVQGSLCVGFDCVNNESFGFDTIRLKENNTRIKAEDTSVGTFPTNDWQLTFNDSASGGASKFSVEDITGAKVPMTITAGASTNSLFIDSTGRVGFRTATPVLDLHVATSNTPAVRLEQNNSGGFTAQTWDIGGNEANFFIRDVTGGSRLSFRIRPGAPTSSLDISADGDVGIGTASPDVKLDIDTGSNTAGLRLRGLAETTEIADFFLTNTGALILSTVNGAGSQSYIDVRPEDDSYGLVLRESTGVASFPYANFFVTDGAEDVLTIDMNSAKAGDFSLTASGSVGLGTMSPLSRLHVNGGDIRVTGGSFIDDGTTLNVPDYVFGDSYKLMPLAELSRFIRANKHLPNVPSAAQVKQNGLNMSQMQMRLLEKVEELTLYTLTQHDTIAELRSANDDLRVRLEKLENLLQQSR